jgi:hypothetical protein
MKRFRGAVTCAVFSLLAFASSASATSFTLTSYTVNATVTDPGLVVFVNHVLPEPFSFDLAGVGDSLTVPLFELGTDETWVNFPDDWVKYPISVAFSFSVPPPPFGGTSTGVTGGIQLLLIDFGYVNWDGPAILDFGTNGQLRVSLSDEWFLVPGSRQVSATFELVRDDIPVPEPATLVLLGTGLLGVAVRWRRR